MCSILQINLCRLVCVCLIPYSNSNTNNCRELDLCVCVCVAIRLYVVRLTSHSWDLGTEENWICARVFECESVCSNEISHCCLKLFTSVSQTQSHNTQIPRPLWRVHIAMTGQDMLTNQNVFWRYFWFHLYLPHFPFERSILGLIFQTKW